MSVQKRIALEKKRVS